jgi:hypothetical protein
MKLSPTIKYCSRSLTSIVLWIILFISTTIVANGQELPPRPLTVTVNLSQNLSFGAFYHGNAGGSVIIYNDGARSSTGDIVLLTMGYSFSTGLYDVIANPGTLISILNGPDAILTGSNGGFMILHIGESNPGNPFILTTPPPMATQIRIGGTLTVGNPLANPPGNYGGTFDVTLVQE